MTDKCNCGEICGEEKCGCSCSNPSTPSPPQPPTPIPPPSDDSSGSESTVGSIKFPSDNSSEMTVLKVQELNSLVPELTDQEINLRPTENIEPIESDIELGLGEIRLLKVRRQPFLGNTPSFIWENSDPMVVCLNPTQSLIPGTVLGLTLGNATISATNSQNPKEVVRWNIQVIKKEISSPQPPIPSDPSIPSDPIEIPGESCGCCCKPKPPIIDPSDPNLWNPGNCNCGDNCVCTPAPCIDVEEIIRSLRMGGRYNINSETPLQIDLQRQPVIVDGFTLEINLGPGITILNEGITFDVREGGVLKISGSGSIIGGEGRNGCSVKARSGSKVYISGGNFITTGDGFGTGNSCIESTGGKVEITGGTFEATEDYQGNYYTLNITDNLETYNAKNYIIVSGGIFKNQDPQMGDPGRGGNFVKDGYHSIVLDENTWEVEPVKYKKY